MPADLDSLMEQSRTALLAFLNVEADLGRTFATSATDHMGNAGHCEALKQKAIKALETIDRFMGRVGPDVRPQIEARRTELAQMMSTLP